jgi:formyltetrahydrofolate synthetase
MDAEKLRRARQLGRELQVNIHAMVDTIALLMAHPDTEQEQLDAVRESMVNLSKHVKEANEQIDLFNNKHRLPSFTALPHIKIKRS